MRVRKVPQRQKKCRLTTQGALHHRGGIGAVDQAVDIVDRVMSRHASCGSPASSDIVPAMNRYRYVTAAAVVAAVLLATACNMSGVPRVAGTYSGTMTMQVGALLARAPMHLTVTQSGAQVTVSGSVSYEGYTWGFPPAMTGTVDATGVFTAESLAGAAAPGVSSRTECGTFGGGYFTLTFSGDQVHLNMLGQTSLCGTISFDATLRR